MIRWLRRRHQENAAATREGFIEQQYKLPQLCPFPEDICVTEYVDTSIWVGFVMVSRLGNAPINNQHKTVDCDV